MALTNTRVRSLATVSERLEAGPQHHRSERFDAMDDGEQATQLFVESLRRYKWLIFAMVVLGGVLAGTAALLVPPSYSGTAQLLVRLGPSENGETSSTGQGPTASQDSAVDTHVTVLTSEAYLRHLLPEIRGAERTQEQGHERTWANDLRGFVRDVSGRARRLLSISPGTTSDDDAIAALKRGLKIGQERRSAVISIAYSAPDPERAAAVANIVAQSYVDYLLRKNHADMEQSLASLTKQSNDVRGKLTKAEGDLSAYKAAHPSTTTSVELEWQISTLAQQYETLLQRTQEVTERQLTARPAVSVLALASKPDRPVSLSPLLLLPPAVLAFAIMGCFIAFGLRRFDRTLDSGAATTKALNIPCIGVSPAIGRGARHSTHLLERPNSDYAKTVRAIFASLWAVRPAAKPQRKVILVTSSVPDEGKTTLAWSLACCAASLGLRTLLVDFEQAKPVTGEQINPRPIAMDRQWSDGVVKPTSGGLHHLSVSICDGLLFRILAGSSALPFIEREDDIYDFVIIDSPSLRHEPEAKLLVKLADHVLLALRWRTTSRDVALDALDQLMRAGHLSSQERQFSAVLTRAESSSPFSVQVNRKR